MYMTIERIKHNGIIVIEYNGIKCRYMGYSLHKAISKFRQDNGLKYKRIEYIFLGV